MLRKLLLLLRLRPLLESHFGRKRPQPRSPRYRLLARHLESHLGRRFEPLEWLPPQPQSMQQPAPAEIQLSYLPSQP